VKIAGSFHLPTDQERAYRILQDPQVLAECMPGCKRLEKTGEDQYRMQMHMVLGSISGQFEGSVRVADQAFPTSFRLIVEGAGRVGFVRGDGQLSLSPDATGTDITYEGEVHAGGTIAAVGQRLLDATSKLIIKRFVGKLSQTLGERPR